MRTSSRARVLDYLGSTPNLLGSGLGLVALFVVAITGLAGAQWPALVILVYVAGVAIGRLTFAGTGAGGHPPPAARPRRAVK